MNFEELKRRYITFAEQYASLDNEGAGSVHQRFVGKIIDELAGLSRKEKIALYNAFRTDMKKMFDQSPEVVKENTANIAFYNAVFSVVRALRFIGRMQETDSRDLENVSPQDVFKEVALTRAYLSEHNATYIGEDIANSDFGLCLFKNYSGDFRDIRAVEAWKDEKINHLTSQEKEEFAQYLNNIFGNGVQARDSVADLVQKEQTEKKVNQDALLKKANDMYETTNDIKVHIFLSTLINKLHECDNIELEAIDGRGEYFDDLFDMYRKQKETATSFER